MLSLVVTSLLLQWFDAPAVRTEAEGLIKALHGGVLRSACCCDSKLRSTRSGVDLGLIELRSSRSGPLSFIVSGRGWRLAVVHVRRLYCDVALQLTRPVTGCSKMLAVEFRQAKMWIGEDLDGAAVKVGA
ncbi:hypothetical protein CASFOL_014472 [Castilleja foliolosa]|uniref:Secreted protein n=1 Tax=Castilleja foliolosa TaxID=1961234 RepID=A0ABD3DPW1_9LAMI